jgi:hypothetical protein
MISVEDIKRFWAKVDRGASCWVWHSSLNNKGYGQFHLGKGNVLAHRFLWEILHGPVPRDLVVMHTCDNPACVNPKHLRIGTVSDNQKDMACKHRSGNMGERSPQAKLSDEKVRSIRSRAANGESNAALAREFGVTRVVIRGVVRRARWSHVA